MMRFPIQNKDLRISRISSGYGPRWGRFHRGVDIAMPQGTMLVAPADGIVYVNATNRGGPTEGYGHYLILHHPELKKFTLYAHLRKLSEHRVGAKVKAEQSIAVSGNTGNSTGPHLHFEIHEDEHKFPARVNNHGGEDDPTIDPVKYYGLKDFMGKSSLTGADKVLYPEPEPPKKEDKTYKVRSGDNLSKIASQFRTSVKNLVEWNQRKYPSLRSNPNYIRPGWVLVVREGKKEDLEYTVVAGDTLSMIAKRHNVKTNDLVQWNQSKYPGLKKDPNLIFPGWKLVIK